MQTTRTTRQRILDAMGLTRHSEYVTHYFDLLNMRSVIYMCVTVLLLETWVINHYVDIILHAESDKVRQLPWIVSHMWPYVTLSLIAIITLILAILYQREKIKSRIPPVLSMVVFALSCAAFGLYIGLDDYKAGEQILTFMTMALFVLCLITWRPVVSLLLSTGMFYGFYTLCNQISPASNATRINLATMWVAITMVAFAHYASARSRARQAEELEQANEQLRAVAYTDDLTGIPNARAFRNAVAELMATVDDPTNYVVMYLDIEGVKGFNEKHGFHAGDYLLRAMANELRAIYPDVPVARVSDDHYVVCCKTDEWEEGFKHMSDRLNEMRSNVTMTLKCGVYVFEDNHTKSDVAVECARRACALTKGRFGEDVYFYDEKLREEFIMRQHVLNHVDEAVEKGWIQPYYQPVMRLSDTTIYGLEALARWEDPEYGLLPPFRFIDVLEDRRQIHKVDRCIIKSACRLLSERMAQGKWVVPVSVNLSRLDFELCDIAGYIIQCCETYGVPASLIDVEITESALSSTAGPLNESLHRMREYGFSLWLDDFGSGYSSLNVLKDFEFDVLKIDMQFLKDFETNPRGRELTQEVVRLAKNLGLTTLTEGVETDEQRAFLREIGCDRGQGYLFSKPVTGAELTAAVDEGRLFLPAEATQPRS